MDYAILHINKMNKNNIVVLGGNVLNMSLNFFGKQRNHLISY